MPLVICVGLNPFFSLYFWDSNSFCAVIVNSIWWLSNITHSYFSFRLPYKLRHSKTHPTQASIEIYPVENRQTELPINYKNPLYWLHIPLPRYKVSYICWHPYKRSTLRTCLVGKLLTQVYTYLSTSKMLRYFGWPTCQLALQNYDMRKDMMRDQFLLLTIRQVNNWNRILCFFCDKRAHFREILIWTSICDVGQSLC